MNTTNDKLLDNLRGGRDQRAWREFFATYAPLLMSFAKRLGLSDADAADAVQETLLAIVNVFRDMSEPFDRRRGRFKSWLFSIAEHKARDVQRRRGRAAAAADVAALTRPVVTATELELERVFESEWQAHLLAQALRQVATELDPAVYQAFELYTVHGEPAERVARLLGTTRNAVYISKTRVLRRVREVLNTLMSEGDES